MPPVAIMREQASYLVKNTKGLIEGIIRTQTEGPVFVHHFILHVPMLDHYQYVLFTVRHQLPFYPAEIIPHSIPGRNVTVSGEEQFVDQLRRILNAEETKRVLNALLAQSQSAENAAP